MPATKTKPKDNMPPKSKKSGDVHGVKPSVEDALAELHEQWAEIEEPAGIDVPDGRYIAEIKEATLNRSKNSGRLQVSWQLAIAEGEYKGRYLFKHDGLDSATGLSFFRGSLARLGMDWPDSPDEIPGVLEQLVGTFAQVTTKTKDGAEIQNTYFTRGLPDYNSDGNGDAGEDDEPATPASRASKKPHAKKPKSKDDDDGEETETSVSIEVDMKVRADYDGEESVGKVTEVDAEEQTATVLFDDGTSDTLNWSDLQIVAKVSKPAGKPKPSTPPSKSMFPVGSAVEAQFDDGEWYPGKVVSLKGDTREVKFEDGQTAKFMAADLRAPMKSGGEADDEPSTVEGVEITFDDDSLTPPLSAKIKRLAKQCEFDPQEYESLCDLIVDVAEASAISGEFSDPKVLLSKIEQALQ